MNYSRALQQAKCLARETGEFRYIVREPEEGYQVADEVDLDTFYLGATPVTCIGPDGLEYASH
jgi:hypothetical protein